MPEDSNKKRSLILELEVIGDDIRQKSDGNFGIKDGEVSSESLSLTSPLRSEYISCREKTARRRRHWFRSTPKMRRQSISLDNRQTESDKSIAPTVVYPNIQRKAEFVKNYDGDNTYNHSQTKPSSSSSSSVLEMPDIAAVTSSLTLENQVAVNTVDTVGHPLTYRASPSFLRKILLSVKGRWGSSRRKSSCRATYALGVETMEGSSLVEDNEKRKPVILGKDYGQQPSGMVHAKNIGMRRFSELRRRCSLYYFPENERRIRANDREFNSQFIYANNYIKTSKYTLLTFLPFNLLEQFQRLANFYFLCLLVLQLVPAISSLTPVTTAIPLIGVLTLTAVKDAYDDIQRHISDNQVNNRKSKTLRNGDLIEEKWADVQVGDIIRLENNQFVAADILLLSTSEPNGLCFIETAELDGETNLKSKHCYLDTNVLSQNHELLWQFKGEIACEKPNNLLNKFEGTLFWNMRRYALDNEKILLRGCVLRNTKWCYGVVIFAGKDTKLMQNSGKTQFKSTCVDRLLNYIIIGIVLFLLSVCTFFTIACTVWENSIGQHFRDYLPWEKIIPSNVVQGSTVIGLLVFFSYAIVLNTFVPISLYVSVEVIRFVQSFLINWDKEMYYEPKDTHAKARTTTLNEELGQIQYIFSDKTGTLTQNIMTFNKCSINGVMYGDTADLDNGDALQLHDYVEPVDFSANSQYEPNFHWYDRTLVNAVDFHDPKVYNFFRLLSLCHTVMPRKTDNRLEYQAQSPDEAALVSAARNFGFVFQSRTPLSITIQVKGQIEEYEVLHILDFNNVRKRMSVILRREDRIVLYCKGADNVIYERLAPGQDILKTVTQQHLNEFAAEGLRTLALADRHINQEFYSDWSMRHFEASTSMENREDKLNAVYEEIESGLSLVGVTAIEDKLQDGVSQTICKLQTAGIKVWMLTGDKQDTAINIGYSCQLLTDDMAEVFIIDGTTMEEVEKQINQFMESIRIVSRFRPTILSDDSLDIALGPLQNGIWKYDEPSYGAHLNDIRSASFLNYPPPAISVVTFRWDDEREYRFKGQTDSEESGHNLPPPPVEVIDDSAEFALVINGNSLVHCLSPALEQKFVDITSKCRAVICCRVTPLQKALVVELIKRKKKAVTLAIGDGANDVSMIKAANIGVGISGQEGLQAVLASDYSIAQFCYLERLLLVHGRWSYYRMCKFLRYFIYKNFAFTLCHCWYSIFCGYSAQTVFDPMFISLYNLFYTSLPVMALGIFEQDVTAEYSLAFPKLYTPGLRNELFNIKQFIFSVLHGAFSSMILFLIPYGTYHLAVSENGVSLSDHMTLGSVVATILIIDNTAQIALHTTYWTVFNHITVWGSLLWYFILDYSYNYIAGGPYVGSLNMAMKDLTFWATMIATVVITLMPVLAFKFCIFDVRPNLVHQLRLQSKVYTLRPDPSLTRPHTRRSLRSLRSGYAFAHQEGFGRLITSGKIMRRDTSVSRRTTKTFSIRPRLSKTKPGSQSLDEDVEYDNNYDSQDNKIKEDNEAENNLRLSDTIRFPKSHRADLELELSTRAPCQDLDTISL